LASAVVLSGASNGFVGVVIVFLALIVASMMAHPRTAVIIVLAVLAIAYLAYRSNLWKAQNRRENYGPPSGRHRALTLEELGDRGWPMTPMEYWGTTASSVSHVVERSA
jgi:hypothetical protein